MAVQQWHLTGEEHTVLSKVVEEMFRSCGPRRLLDSVTTSDQRETCGEFSSRGTGFRDTMPMDERRGCFNTHQGYKRNELQMSAVQPRVLR